MSIMSIHKNLSKFDFSRKRMLKLELTDGTTTISAMEYQTIKVLNTKLTPGVKIAISGPVRCVNRVLLLESKNVKILGGEVDTLLICNAYENVLLQILKKPLNPNPITDYEGSSCIINASI
jgi:RecQ-mediated genome instability protein 1